MGGIGVELNSASFGPQWAVLNCPPHALFIPTLASAILDGSIWNAGAPNPHDLPALTVYLPTHATVEPLKLAFLSLAPNGATFLPRIRVLGDADPLDLFATYGTRMASAGTALRLLKDALAIPAAFSELERQIHLSAFILDAAQGLRGTKLAADERLFADIPAASAYTIAAKIAALIDEAHTEAVELARIDKLDNGNSSGSEQLSLQLLRAVRKSWQAHKAKTGRLDREERRNRLMAIEAEFIRRSDAPVIIAGSTGSVAATMRLMEAVVGRPKSAIVFHGLDDNLDPETWAAAGGNPEHPQHGLHRLLGQLNIRREGIRNLAPVPEDWIGVPPHPVLLPEGRREDAATSPLRQKAAPFAPSPLGERVGVRGDSPIHASPEPDQGSALRRSKFLSEALRPARTTAKWASFIQALKDEEGQPALGLSLIEAETIQEEAATIALILRESLETGGQTAALVTPDDKLMNRVRHALSRWGLASDSPASPRQEDIFAARIASCAAHGKPEDFVTLLRYAQGHGGAEIRRFAETIDLGVLRQMWRPSSVTGIPSALARAEHAASAGEARHPAMKRIAAAEWHAARTFAARAVEILTAMNASPGRRLNLSGWVSVHSEVLSRLSALGLRGASAKDKEGTALDEWANSPAPSLKLDLANYAGFFAEAIAAGSKERMISPHPRLFLWRPLDARLLSADVIVLGGLNEGCWPQTIGPDPFLSRRDRAFLGLSPQEHRIGQTAQIFAALATGGRHVTLTRSKKVNGSLTRPSRWISRIKALAAGAEQSKSLDSGKPWLAWARAHHALKTIAAIAPPEPRPPLSARPRRMSVTAIETWFANPYSIHARHILHLEPLRRLDETNDARDKGILYHAALHCFFKAYPGALPKNAAEKLLNEFDKAAKDLGFNLETAPFWRPRFARFAAWFADAEAARRADIRVLKSEVGGKLTLDAPAGPFEITARADRIDMLCDGTVCIYDFKTGANTAKVSAARGAPQLALEGLLAREGAFAGIPMGSAAELSYIVATGGDPPGEIVTLKMPSAEAIQAAHTGIVHRIARFDDAATPYGYEVRAIYRDKAENDPYAHLARVLEWSLDGSAEADDD
jgi:ATP-dependent helicase/nuclease subunit B